MARGDFEFERLRANLARFDENVEDNLSDQMEKPLSAAVANARSNAPFRSGDLRRSINYEVSKREQSFFSTSPYASIFENGGTHPVFGQDGVEVYQEPRPFMSPAIHGQEDNIDNARIDAIKHAARKAGYH